MHPYSPISWLYVHGFLGQNFKRLDLGVIAGYLEKRISVRALSPNSLKVSIPNGPLVNGHPGHNFFPALIPLHSSGATCEFIHEPLCYLTMKAERIHFWLPANRRCGPRNQKIVIAH